MPRSVERLFTGIATALAIVALVGPTTRAQCPQARSFGGFPGGKTGSQVIVDASAFENLGNEFAQFWETGIVANGTGVGAAGSCDSQDASVGWWQFVGTSTLRGIRGFVAQPGCVLPVCPGVGSGLTFLVEELTADGQGGGFIMYQSDETPNGPRWYDHARTDHDAGPGTSMTHVMGTLPTVIITGVSGVPPMVMVTADYLPDVGSQFHGVEGPANTQLPGSAGIESYDVMWFHGVNPPDSLRSNWNLLKKIPYNDSAIFGDVFTARCPEPVDSDYVAIGLTFVGGVESLTVGPPSLPVPCYHMVAQPELPVRQPSPGKPRVGNPNERRRPSRR